SQGPRCETKGTKQPSVNTARYGRESDSTEMQSHVYQILFVTESSSNDQRVTSLLQDAEDYVFSVRKMVPSPHIAAHMSFCKWDAVIWDLSNPTKDDLDALKSVCSGSNSFPVIALISEERKQIGRQAIDLGASEYFPTNQLSKELLQRGLRYAIERSKEKISVRQIEQRFSDLFENTNDILFTLDLEGRVTSVNKAAEDILGWSRTDALQINIKSLVAPEYVAVCTEMMRRILNEEPLQHFEIGLIDKHGRKVLLEASARLIRLDGKKSGVQGIARDVTERRHLENAVHQSQKLEAIGRLSGGLAHDFNNLLCVISGHSELLAEQFQSNGTALRSIMQIRKATDSAASLTRQLLAFSRRQVIHPQILDLNSIVAETEKLLGRLIDENIEFYTALDPTLGRVRVDPVQMEQVILNLVLNARDSMPQGGKLTIGTSNIELEDAHQSKRSMIPAGQYVLLSITDTGSGMNEETQSRIFEPFYTTKEFGKGTGLGLATVYGIVKQSGGYIWVYSEEGRGTTFKIYLPRAISALTAARSVRRNTEMLRGTETIFVVEDSEPLRALTRDFLLASGYKVLEAANGEDALRLARAHEGEIDLLLTDVVMPKLGGKLLVDELLQFRPKTRVLFMSGYPNDGILQAGILTERVPLLEKPFTREILAERVRQMLDEPVLAS
ncbi:MAG TPA: ATP-binding protein, partial [Candidatus Eremiobacteraceae bacterium]|nr:ATP-binding protein [Candidatus Eremiobacteraceae bacterium]